jgi:transposase
MITERPTTPPNQRILAREYDTITKLRFFQSFDQKGEKSLGNVLQDIQRDTGKDIHRSAAYRWLKARETHGDIALRRQRPQSTRLGQNSKLSDEQLDLVLSPTRKHLR